MAADFCLGGLATITSSSAQVMGAWSGESSRPSPGLESLRILGEMGGVSAHGRRNGITDNAHFGCLGVKFTQTVVVVAWPSRASAATTPISPVDCCAWPARLDGTWQACVTPSGPFLPNPSYCRAYQSLTARTVPPSHRLANSQLRPKTDFHATEPHP